MGRRRRVREGHGLSCPINLAEASLIEEVKNNKNGFCYVNALLSSRLPRLPPPPVVNPSFVLVQAQSSVLLESPPGFPPSPRGWSPVFVRTLGMTFPLIFKGPPSSHRRNESPSRVARRDLRLPTTGRQAIVASMLAGGKVVGISRPETTFFLRHDRRR